MENEKRLKEQIQVEQECLLKVEKELKKMLNKINEHKNTLKVEELQLKANVFSDKNQFSSQNDAKETKYKMIEIPDFINSQKLDLKVNQVNINTFNEEYDSE